MDAPKGETAATAPKAGTGREADDAAPADGTGDATKATSLSAATGTDEVEAGTPDAGTPDTDTRDADPDAAATAPTTTSRVTEIDVTEIDVTDAEAPPADADPTGTGPTTAGTVGAGVETTTAKVIETTTATATGATATTATATEATATATGTATATATATGTTATATGTTTTRAGTGAGTAGSAHVGSAPFEARTTLPAEVPTAPDQADRWRREEDRRHTRNFLLFFLSTIGVGLVAYTFWLGLWAAPFGGGHRPGCVPGTPTPTAAPIGQTSVRVYNATARRGLALNVARDLQKRGFTVPMYDNDTAASGMKSAAEIRHGPDGVLNARTVQAQVVGNVVLVQDNNREGPTVDLILGNGFAKLRPPADAAKLIATPTDVPEECPGAAGAAGAAEERSTPSPRGTSAVVTRPAPRLAG